MCGISGFNWKDKDTINKMIDILKHRGPDDVGTYTDDYLTLGHNRLSIIDLTEKGHQPMFNDDKTLLIIHNGEVYNYKEIRAELEEKGYSFFSNSDTEVVLKSYQEWGENCLSKFNGMFAFCIYDIKNKKLFFARDRFGIKPFYYYLRDEKFIFASEIKAILCHDIDRITNDKLIFDFLTFNILDHTEETFFEGIMKLPKGNYGIYNLEKNRLDIIKYYDIRKYCFTDNKLKYKEAVQKFKRLFNDSIKLRLRSDVQVGSCFSGGLDSSSIVSLMNEYIDNDNISTFSAVYPGFEKDESYYIDKQVKKMGIKNEKISPTVNDLLDDIEDFIYCQEGPTRSTSQYSQYCVMKLARRNNFKVLLDGQGSDEILAGYHYFYGYYFLELIKKLKFFTLFKELKYYKKNVDSYIGLTGIFFLLLPSYFKMKYFIKSSSFIDYQFKKIWKDKSEYIENVLNQKGLKNVLLSHIDYKLEELLRWEDRNSMAFSIETRVPFLDYRFVEFIFSLPSSFIIRNGLTKAILRDAMDGKVEKEIIKRTDKIGFETPEDKWIREEPISNFIRDIISSSSFRNRKYFDSEKIIKYFEVHLAGRINCGMKIWQCIFLELWLRKFIDNFDFKS